MRKVYAVLCALPLLAGCAMIDTYPAIIPSVEGSEVPNGVRVEQASGSYFLAKHLLRVAVSVQGAKKTLIVTPVAVQDRSTLMQIGFNLSPLSDDDVTVKTSDGLLKSIEAKAVDKTGDIIVEIAKAVGYFRGALAPDGGVVATVLEFDPFDFQQARQVNAMLTRKFGSCVEVEIFENTWTPGCGRMSIGTPAAEPPPSGVFAPRVPGVYYRRPLNHRVHVVENGRTSELKSYALANLAPVFRLDIERTAFVTRQTKIDFKDGAPESVQVVKESEALAVAKLPVRVVEAYVGGAVDAITNRKKLVDAQTDYVKSESAYLDALTGKIKSAQSLQAAFPTPTLPTNASAGKSLLSGPAGLQVNPVAPLNAIPFECTNAGYDTLEKCRAAAIVPNR